QVVVVVCLPAHLRRKLRMKLFRRALRIVDDLVLAQRWNTSRVEPAPHHEGPEYKRNHRRENGTWQGSTSPGTHWATRYCLRSEPNSLLKKPVGLCTDGCSASSSQ